MKFVSNIFLSALFLIGLSIAFVGCQKEESSEIESTYNSLFLPFDEAAIPLNYLKSISFIYDVDDSDNPIVHVTYNGVTVTWTSGFVGEGLYADAMGAQNGSWVVPTWLDFQNLCIACAIEKVDLIKKVGFPGSNGCTYFYGDGTSKRDFVGGSTFWLSDVKTSSNGLKTYVMAVKTSVKKLGTCETQVPTKSSIRLVQK